MKPVTPLPGFNVRRTATTCCGCFSRETQRTVYGTYYCKDCYQSARAYSRSKPCADETRGNAFSVQSEGVDALSVRL